MEELVCTIDTWEIERTTDGEARYVGTNKNIKLYATPYFCGEWEAEIIAEDIKNKTEIARIAGFSGLGIYLEIKSKVEKQFCI